MNKTGSHAFTARFADALQPLLADALAPAVPALTRAPQTGPPSH
jgi:hypothetical protein